jgi:hypothetical protein
MLKITGIVLMNAVLAFSLPSHCFAGKRIVGGQDADAREFQYQVFLHGGGYTCGGVLIADRFVLTAAHCGDYMDMVIIGAHTLNNKEECRETRTVVRRVDYPTYNNPTYAQDIALLELDAPSEYTPIKLFTHQPDLENLEAAGTMLTVSGWGRLSDGGPAANVLQKAQVPVISNAECQAKYPEETITDSMFCAAYPGGGVDACQGDSGGPIVGVDSLGDYYLVGLVSWGYGCARATRPGVYTRVSTFHDWVCENGVDEVCGTHYGTNYWVNYVWSFWLNYYFMDNFSSLFIRSSRAEISVVELPSSFQLPPGVVSHRTAASASAEAAVTAAIGRGRSRTRARGGRAQSSSLPQPEAELPEGHATALREYAKQAVKEAKQSTRTMARTTTDTTMATARAQRRRERS